MEETEEISVSSWFYAKRNSWKWRAIVLMVLWQIGFDPYGTPEDWSVSVLLFIARSWATHGFALMYWFCLEAGMTLYYNQTVSGNWKGLFVMALSGNSKFVITGWFCFLMANHLWPRDRIKLHGSFFKIRISEWAEKLNWMDGGCWLLRVEARSVSEVNSIRACIEMQGLTEVQQKYAKDEERKASGNLALVFFVVVAIMSVAIDKSGLVMLVAVLFGTVANRKGFKAAPRVHDNSDKIFMPDCIVSMEAYFLFFRVGVGVGVVWRGVLHTRYHVSGDVPLMYEGEGRLHCVPTKYVDKDADIVTWGGMPCLVTPPNETKLYPIIYNPYLKTKLQAFQCVYNEGVGMLCPKTISGTSGSPIFWFHEDGSMELGFLTGRCVDLEEKGWNSAVTQIELLASQVGVNSEVPMVGNSKQIVRGPGHGKTRVILPAIVKQNILAGRDTIVSGPTRAITDIMLATIGTLLEEEPRLREDVRVLAPYRFHHSVRKFVRAKNLGSTCNIIVAPHAIAISKLYEAKRKWNKTTLILDEAHTVDAATIALRSYGLSIHRQCPGFAFVEMSATTTDWETREIKLDSNLPYAVEDHVFNDLRGLVRELFGKGLRVMVFCPTVQRGETSVKTLKKKITAWTEGQCEIIEFHRQTYATQKQKVENLEQGVGCFVLASDAAEAGITPACDVVVDLGQSMTWVRSDNYALTFRLQLNTSSIASQIQRRGRVGRRNVGDYYRKEGVVPREEIYAQDSYEGWCAKLLMDALGADFVYHGKLQTGTSTVRLSKDQAIKYLEGNKDETLWSVPYVYYRFGRDGRLRTDRELVKFIQDEGVCEDSAICDLQVPGGPKITVRLRLHIEDVGFNAFLAEKLAGVVLPTYKEPLTAHAAQSEKVEEDGGLPATEEKPPDPEVDFDSLFATLSDDKKKELVARFLAPEKSGWFHWTKPMGKGDWKVP